jgi:hypothetical protein
MALTTPLSEFKDLKDKRVLVVGMLALAFR